MLEESHQETEVQPAGAGSAPTDPASPPLEDVVDRFWELGPEFESIEVRIEPPDSPLALLEQLGPSPFERGEFPLIGFLATTYDKVGRYAAERD